MAYWSPSALSALANSESSGQADLVHYPNNVAWGGTSTQGSSASGLYGYLTSTWQTYAPQAGVDISQYPYAYTAPASVQTQVAAITPISNWTCPGCNSTASALAENPSNIQASPASISGSSSAFEGLGDPNLTQLNDPAYQTGLPTYGDATASDTTGLPFGSTGNTLPAEGYYGGALHVNVTGQTGLGGTGGNTSTYSQPGTIANTGVISSGASGAGTPVQLNLGSGTVADIGNWIAEPITAAEQWASAQFAQLSNWFTRGMLIALAIVVILVALWRLSGGPSTTQIITAAKAAA